MLFQTIGIYTFVTEKFSFPAYTVGVSEGRVSGGRRGMALGEELNGLPPF